MIRVFEFLVVYENQKKLGKFNYNIQDAKPAKWNERGRKNAPKFDLFTFIIAAAKKTQTIEKFVA